MALVLGVDGGNTKTLAVVADTTGRVLGAARAGIGDIYAFTPDAAFAQIDAAVTEALSQAEADPEQLDAAAFSLAGADWPEDFALLESELPTRLRLRGHVSVVNDALGALRGGSPDWGGVSIVLGTWGAIGARHPGSREIFHLGFWPDGAGARDLGHDALRAVYRADLGLAAPTSLTPRALARFSAATPMALLHDFTRRGGRDEAEEALLAPDVLAGAGAGDETALGIVRGQARIVSAHARLSATRVGLALEGLPVVLTGGVLSHPSTLFSELTMAGLPGARLLADVPPPIAGAVMLAFDALGAPGDAAAIAAALPSSLLSGQRSPAWAGSHSNM